MSAETIPMFPDLPIDNPEEKKRVEPPTNRLQEMMIKLVNRRKVQLVDIQNNTGIAWSTLMSWYRGATKGQVADERLYKLAQYFDVSLEYLCFGVGKDPHFNGEENE